MSRETNLLRAQLLIEAADLLNEGAARDKRKEIISEKDSIKNNQETQLFLKGRMNKEDANRKYTEVKQEINNLREKINEIPEENFGEKFAMIMRSQFSPRNFGWALLISLISIIVYRGAVSTIATTNISNKALETVAQGVSSTLGAASDFALIITYFGKPTETNKYGNKVYNYNKSYAIKKVDALENKVDKIYDKYYK